MDKWFKLFDEWIIETQYCWTDIKKKELWKLFEIEVKKISNIQPDKKIQWFKLNYESTRKKLIPKKVEFESCFEIKEMKL